MKFPGRTTYAVILPPTSRVVGDLFRSIETGTEHNTRYLTYIFL